jgi:hypothetical protein
MDNELKTDETIVKAATTKGLSVAEKRFEFTLPVSKEKILIRYSTRKDKKDAQLYAGKGEDADEKFELLYLSYVISGIDGSPINVLWLENLTEKDFNYIRICDNKVNAVSKEDIDQLTVDFAIAQK